MSGNFRAPQWPKTFADANSPRKHNPFMSFLNIQNSTARCQNIVNAETNFALDVAKGAHAPQYMYYVPNLKNDAHDTNITFTEKDLANVVDTMLNNKEFMKNTLILITFDENGKLPPPMTHSQRVSQLILFADIFAPQFYGTPNDVYSVLLGNDTLKCYGCLDQQFYNRKCQLFFNLQFSSVVCVC